MLNDTLIDNTIWILRKAFKKNKAQIWKALEKEFSKSRSDRRLINIQRLDKITNNGDIVVFPGKFLGNGRLGLMQLIVFQEDCVQRFQNYCFKVIGYR